jgi:hypothetical protein
MKSVHQLVHKDYSERIDNMIKKINETFGITISRVKASKLLAYKDKNTIYNFKPDELLKLLGGQFDKR